jgi:hypothetical protein
MGGAGMKLEAGKKYRTRNGEIVDCLAVWTKAVSGYQATVLRNGDTYIYALNGRRYPQLSEHHHDIVAEYTEPKRVADYAVPAGDVARELYVIRPHPIGTQPEGALKIEGSERDE